MAEISTTRRMFTDGECKAKAGRLAGEIARGILTRENAGALFYPADAAVILAALDKSAPPETGGEPEAAPPAEAAPPEKKARKKKD